MSDSPTPKPHELAKLVAAVIVVTIGGIALPSVLCFFLGTTSVLTCAGTLSLLVLICAVGVFIGASVYDDDE